MSATTDRQSRLIVCDGREDWLARRREGIGASDAAAILGLSPWRSPFAVWADKVAPAPLTDEESEAMRWGTVLEAPIREEYERRTQRTVQHTPWAIAVNRDIHWLRASLDGQIVAGPDLPIADAPGVYEGKTASARKAGEWSAEPPIYYQIQVQHQLAVCGLQWGSIAVLLGGQKLVWFDVQRNDRFIAALIRRLEEFWWHVEKKVTPAVDHTEATKNALAQLWPEDTGREIALPPVAVEKGHRLEELKQLEKSIKVERSELENWFRAELQDATYGVAPDGQRWSLKTQTRKAHMVKESTCRVLRALKHKNEEEDDT